MFPATIRCGMTDESPLEHVNKFIKDFLVNHSRQISYEARNEDTMNRLLDQSDPLVLVTYDTQAKSGPIHPYPEAVLNLCLTSEEIQRSV